VTNCCCAPVGAPSAERSRLHGAKIGVVPLPPPTPALRHSRALLCAGDAAGATGSNGVWGLGEGGEGEEERDGGEGRSISS